MPPSLPQNITIFYTTYTQNYPTSATISLNTAITYHLRNRHHYNTHFFLCPLLLLPIQNIFNHSCPLANSGFDCGHYSDILVFTYVYSLYSFFHSLPSANRQHSSNCTCTQFFMHVHRYNDKI